MHAAQRGNVNASLVHSDIYTGFYRRQVHLIGVNAEYTNQGNDNPVIQYINQLFLLFHVRLHLPAASRVRPRPTAKQNDTRFAFSTGSRNIRPNSSWVLSPPTSPMFEWGYTVI